MRYSTSQLTTAALIILLFSLALTPGIAISASNIQLTDTEKKWLADHPSIRIGTMEAWPPMDFIDSNGVAQGIGAKFIEALNQRLDNVLNIVPGPWEKIYSDVSKGKLDGLMGITPSPDRKKLFLFTKPYVTVPHAIFARKNARYLKNLADLKGKTVAVERGFYISTILYKNYPEVTVKEYNSTSDALDAVSKGDAEAYIGNRAVAMYIIETELITNIKQFGKISETSSINAIGIRKDWPILRDILQKALDDISHEEYRKILSKWVFPENKSTNIVNLTLEEKKWLQTHPRIQIAFDGNYPPYSFRNKQGDIVGIAVDYATELANRLDITIDIYPESDWKKLYAAAQQRKVDVIATLVKQDERKKWFEFTRPYISLAQYVITKKEDMQTFNRTELLAGKTVALIKDHSMSQVILQKIRDIKPFYVSTLNEALEAVSTGKAQATVGAIGMANYLMVKNGLLNLGFATLFSKEKTKQRFGVRNDWPELASILDKALQSLSDKDILRIFGRWSQPQVASAEAELFANALKLTDEERNWLSENPVIRTASDPNWAPIEFVDGKGNPQGISADYIKRLEKILGIKFERVKNQSWVEMVENFKKGEIDLFTSVNRTPDREDYINFTEPYTHFPIAIFSGPDSPFIVDMKLLRGKKIGVVKGYATQELLENNYPELELIMASDPIDALERLSREEIDYYIGNILVTGYYIGKLGYTHIKVVGKTPFQYEQSMGVRKNLPILVSILNKALNSISEKEKNAIYDQWIGIRYEHGFDYAMLWKILFIALILFIIFIYWNRKLTTLNKQLTLARKQEEQARIMVEQANKELKAMDKLKSMFIASMSHELRTPLNSIIGFSGLLLQGVTGELNEKQKDSVNRINRSGNHLLGLITDIIDISKIEAGRVETFPVQFSLYDVIEEAIESIKLQADAKAIKISVNADNWPDMISDRKRLLQCLLNYLSNAIKYSEGGNITLNIEVNHDLVNISVIDTGIGISAEDMPRLFEAFERINSHLKVIAGGTGLGLYLTKSIAEKILYGTVAVESRVNVGSTFSLEIPIDVSPYIRNE